MNRNDFLNMIEETEPFNRQTIGEVYELIDIFPYFQSAHMLLLKGLHSSADFKFENQLRLSSIHIADREVLYYLLNRNTSQKVVSGEERDEKGNTETAMTNRQQTVIESAKNSEYLIDEIERSSFETADQDSGQTGNQSVIHPILVGNETDYDYLNGVMLLSEEEEIDNEEKFFYMDPGFSFPDHSDLLELDLDEPLTNNADKIIIQQEQPYHKGENLEKQLQSELIDKFIFNNPRIEPDREKMDLPQEDISKPFVDAGGGFVTETLARIYINQGYYSKAIDIYEKLCLKFPEKSSYFASQIEKVKEYIKK